jgi:hypothetical protein
MRSLYLVTIKNATYYLTPKLTIPQHHYQHNDKR